MSALAAAMTSSSAEFSSDGGNGPTRRRSRARCNSHRGAGGTPLTGGVGSIQRTILGVFIITILSNGMNMVDVDPYLLDIVKGLVIVASVFITIERGKIGVTK